MLLPVIVSMCCHHHPSMGLAFSLFSYFIFAIVIVCLYHQYCLVTTFSYCQFVIVVILFVIAIIFCFFIAIAFIVLPLPLSLPFLFLLCHCHYVLVIVVVLVIVLVIVIVYIIGYCPYTVLCFLLHYCLHYYTLLIHTQTIHVYCDNQGLIDCIQNWPAKKYPCDTICDDHPIYVEIQMVVDNLTPISPMFHQVLGCQDTRKKDKMELSLPE